MILKVYKLTSAGTKDPASVTIDQKKIPDAMMYLRLYLSPR